MKKNVMTEIVYVVTNPAMPGYVKIGRTFRNDVEQRLKELSNATGVPMPFKCLYAAEVDDAAKVEQAFHDAFDCDRPNPKREFFTTDPKRIISLLKGIAKSDVTPATQEMIDQIVSPENKEVQTNAATKTNNTKNISKGTQDINKIWDKIRECAKRHEDHTKKQPDGHKWKKPREDFIRKVKECIAAEDAQRLYEVAGRLATLKKYAKQVLDMQ